MDKPPVDLLCDSFYQAVKPAAAGSAPIPGQLVHAHAVFPSPEPWIVKVLNYDATHAGHSRYEVKKFDAGDKSHFPIAELQLRAEENYYIYVGKQRPLVVVGAVRSRWNKPLHEEAIYLCAPIYSFKPKHTDEFKIRCAAFDHASLFYLPAEVNGCTSDSAVRFEHMQPIMGRALANYAAGSPPHAIALSEAAYGYFANHLGRFLLGKDLDAEVCSQMDAYRELVLEELAKRNP